MADVVAARITIPVNTNAGQATSQLSGLDNQLNKTASTTGKFDNAVSGSTKSLSALGIGAVATASYIGVKLVGAMADFINESVKLASDAEETQQAFNVTFSSIRDEAELTATALAKNFNLAGEEAKRLLFNTGDLLTGFGFAQREALGLSNRVQELAADLVSMRNIEGGVNRASRALTSAILGEREAAKTLGIVISETAIQSRLAAQGKKNLTGNALLQAKAEITLAMAYEQSKNAIGDAARSADSYANQQRRLANNVKDFKVALGAELLPALQEVQKVMLNMTSDSGGFGKSIGSSLRQIIVAIPLAIQGIKVLQSEFEFSFISMEKSVADFVYQLGKTLGNEKMMQAGMKATMAATGAMIDNIKQRQIDIQELRRLEGVYYGTNKQITQNTLNSNANTNALMNNAKAAAEFAKELDKALKISAQAGDISSALALMRKQYAEQYNLVKKYLGDTSALELFHQRKREQDLFKYFETRAEIEGEDFAKRLEWLYAQNEIISNLAYTSAEERLAVEKALHKAIMSEERKLTLARVQFASLMINTASEMVADLQTVFRNAGTESYALAVTFKALSAAQAAIASFLAFDQVLANPTLAALYPANLIAAGITLAAGLAKQAAILSTPIPTAQFGGSFIVPPGNQADSGLLRVNQGERVDVTPASETSNMPNTMTLMVDGRAFRAYVVETAAAGFNSGQAQIRRKGAVKVS